MPTENIRICHNEKHPWEICRGTFEFKGCWNCGYFEYLPDSPLIPPESITEQLGVHPKTVVNLIKKGELDGELLERERDSYGLSLVLSARKKWFVYRDSWLEKKRLLEKHYQG